MFEQLGISAQKNGTVDAEEMDRLQAEFFVWSSQYGAVSFHDFLKEDNLGKKVYVCNGSSCLTAGTQYHVRNEISKRFPSDEIGEMCCLGRCHENSSFHLNGQNYSGQKIRMYSWKKYGHRD
ncbi:MAG: hypothetical protein IPL08_17905 [Saprospiraceae bacterium]|nr:hypothetical protein [Saprospiraceae bacterium]